MPSAILEIPDYEISNFAGTAALGLIPETDPYVRGGLDTVVVVDQNREINRVVLERQLQPFIQWVGYQSPVDADRKLGCMGMNKNKFNW